MPASAAVGVPLNKGWEQGESGIAAQLDENWQTIAALLCLGVLSATTTTPPAENTVGDRYIIPDSNVGGAWTGHEGKVAIWDGTNWIIFTSQPGWNCIAADTGQGWVRTVANQWALRCSLMGSYADDAAASAGGVPVGGEYINSGSGALQVRLT